MANTTATARNESATDADGPDALAVASAPVVPWADDDDAADEFDGDEFDGDEFDGDEDVEPLTAEDMPVINALDHGFNVALSGIEHLQEQLINELFAFGNLLTTTPDIAPPTREEAFDHFRARFDPANDFFVDIVISIGHVAFEHALTGFAAAGYTLPDDAHVTLEEFHEYCDGRFDDLVDRWLTTLLYDVEFADD
ncbi:hypothetical protein Q8F55_003401 [Vanrija albida]|uniref:BART domain-containing protein n=1 Tax=Vanrija albida TaxID=181172 RepID=A0ABR3Q3U0_9TREE